MTRRENSLMTTMNLLINSQQSNRVSSTNIAEADGVVVATSDNSSAMRTGDGAASGDRGSLVVVEEESHGLGDGVAGSRVEHLEAVDYCELA